MKILIVGTGYVGLSNAILSNQDNDEIMAVDIIQEKVYVINKKISMIVDNEIELNLAIKELNLVSITGIYSL